MSLQKTQVIVNHEQTEEVRTVTGKKKKTTAWRMSAEGRSDCDIQLMTFSAFVKYDFGLDPSNGIIKSVDACSKYMLSVSSSLGG